MQPTSLVLLAASSVAAITPLAHAGWTVTVLHPTEAFSSRAVATNAGLRVGRVEVGSDYHAATWTSSQTWVSLTPAGATVSEAADCDGSRQVGWAFFPALNQSRAGMWSDTAASWIDLHPTGAAHSLARAIDGEWQAGETRAATASLRAALWHGSASSYVNLHPAGMQWSTVAGISGGQQIGNVGHPDGRPRAALWFGTSAWIDLTPASMLQSQGNDVHAGTQVGTVGDSTSNYASLWRGSAASWVNLHPAGMSGYSAANGVYGDKQVGVVSADGGFPKAAMWSGTPESYVDLHALIPLTLEFDGSIAEDVWTDGTNIIVAGTAAGGSSFIERAVIWTFTPDLPACDSIDFNNNTVFPEDQDVIDFFNVLGGAECEPCNDIDFNNNGVFPEDQDVIDFFRVLAGGECP